MKRVTLILLALIALTFVLLTLTACISSVDKKYYQLYLPQNSARITGEKSTPQIDKILLVESVAVDDIYNDYRVVYRTSPYHLNYYSYNYWIKKPEVLIRESIVDYLSKTNVFKKVITGFAGGEPDLLLKARVHILEEYDRPDTWFAHLKMEVRISDFKSGQQVLSHSFDQQEQMPRKKIEHLPIAISKILKEELDEMIDKLLK